MITIDRYPGNFNTFDDSSWKICVRNKIDDLNAKVFNLIARIDDVKKIGKTFFMYLKM